MIDYKKPELKGFNGWGEFVEGSTGTPPPFDCQNAPLDEDWYLTCNPFRSGVIADTSYRQMQFFSALVF